MNREEKNVEGVTYRKSRFGDTWYEVPSRTVADVQQDMQEFRFLARTAFTQAEAGRYWQAYDECRAELHRIETK